MWSGTPSITLAGDVGCRPLFSSHPEQGYDSFALCGTGAFPFQNALQAKYVMQIGAQEVIIIYVVVVDIAVVIHVVGIVIVIRVRRTQPRIVTNCTFKP